MNNLVLDHPEDHYTDELIGSSVPITTTEFNIINGHDYTDAEFIEVTYDRKQDILAGLLDPPPSTLALLRLTLPVGPARNFQGLGWQDLFAEKTRYDKVEWLGMHNIHSLASTARMNDDCMFRIWFCPPGLLHVEVDDEGTWTIADILSLPDGMIIG